MNNIILSIIIPVYNLEKYIVKCLDSIYTQGVDESLFEVVAVDDGSRDSSLEKLHDYSSGHSNMLVFSQPNGGVSVARNTALLNIQGDYVTFIDGDDTISYGSLKDVIEQLKVDSNDFDVLYCRSFIKEVDGTLNESHLWQQIFEEGTIYNGFDVLKRDYNNCGSVCGGCYKTQFLREHDLLFGVGIANAEDTIFNYLLYANNPRIFFRDIVYNLVTQRQNSASHSLSVGRVSRFENNFKYLFTLRNNNPSMSMRQAIDASIYHSATIATDMYIRCGGRNPIYLKRLFHVKQWGKLNVPWFPRKRKISLFLVNNCFSLFFILGLFRNRKET